MKSFMLGAIVEAAAERDPIKVAFYSRAVLKEYEEICTQADALEAKMFERPHFAEDVRKGWEELDKRLTVARALKAAINAAHKTIHTAKYVH